MPTWLQFVVLFLLWCCFAYCRSVVELAHLGGDACHSIACGYGEGEERHTHVTYILGWAVNLSSPSIIYRHGHTVSKGMDSTSDGAGGRAVPLPFRPPIFGQLCAKDQILCMAMGPILLGSGGFRIPPKSSPRQTVCEIHTAGIVGRLPHWFLSQFTDSDKEITIIHLL